MAHSQFTQNTHGTGEVAFTRGIMPQLEEEIRSVYGATPLPDDPSGLHDDVAKKIRVVVTNGRVGVSSQQMAALPSLEAVFNFGVGYDTTDIAQAVSRGILVTNTPDVLTDCVADTALALLLDVFRNFGAAERYLRAGSWSGGSFPLTRRFSGSTIGIFGLGRIGQAIARRVSGFEAEVIYHSRNKVQGVPWKYVESLHELAAQSDALVVAVPGGAGTNNIVNSEVLDALGPNGYLVNIARGIVVDEEELVRALEAGRIAGAGLDVFVDEPNVPEGLIRDNVTLLPHVGSATRETRDDMRKLVLDNLESYLKHAKVLTPVAETPQ